MSTKKSIQKPSGMKGDPKAKRDERTKNPGGMNPKSASGSVYANQLHEPLAPFHHGLILQSLTSIFPHCQWDEDGRFDAVFSFFVTLHLVVQMQNIYRFNLGNWDYTLLLLGSLVVFKRTIFRLALGTFAEFRANGNTISGDQARAVSPSTAAVALKMLFFLALFIMTLVLAALLYEKKGTRHKGAETMQTSTGKLLHEFDTMGALIAVVAFAVPVGIDLGLMLLSGQLGNTKDGGAAKSKAEFPGVPQKTWDTLSLKAANDHVVRAVLMGTYSSLEAFYVAGLLPMILADPEIYTFNTWHCQQTALYILIAGLSMTLVHKLSSTVADFSRLEQQSGSALARDVAGFLPLWLSANSTKMYILVAMARFVLLAFLIYGFLTALGSPSFYVCQLALVTLDYNSIVWCIAMWNQSQQHASPSMLS